MKELSLNILDITKKSIKAGATLIEIALEETAETFTFRITDNGCGMDKEMLSRVTNPFVTTRSTRKVGLGIPFIKMQAEMTGGHLTIDSTPIFASPDRHGTTLTAFFYKNHIDFTPLGDIVSTIVTLIQGNPTIDFVFTHTLEKGEVSLDTRQMRELLEGVPLNAYEVLEWVSAHLNDQYSQQFI